jgi:hypothetical protein
LVLFVGDGDEGLRSRQGVWILILSWISFGEEGEDLPALEEGSGKGGKKIEVSGMGRNRACRRWKEKKKQREKSWILINDINI